MFDSLEKYPKPKVKLFFRYLADAASRLEPGEFKSFFRYSPELRKEPVITNNQPLAEKKEKLMVENDKQEYSEDILTDEMPIERIEQLETKISMFFTKNQYLPYEMQLAKIDKKVDEMYKSGEYDKRKLRGLKSKIKKCGSFIKKLRKMSA